MCNHELITKSLAQILCIIDIIRTRKDESDALQTS